MLQSLIQTYLMQCFYRYLDSICLFFLTFTSYFKFMFDTFSRQITKTSNNKKITEKKSLIIYAFFCFSFEMFKFLFNCIYSCMLHLSTNYHIVRSIHLSLHSPYNCAAYIQPSNQTGDMLTIVSFVFLYDCPVTSTVFFPN